MQNSEAISQTGFSLMPVVWIVIIVGLGILAVFLYHRYQQQEKEKERIEKELKLRQQQAAAEQKAAEEEQRAAEAQRSKLLEELCGYCQELDRLEQEHDEETFAEYGHLLQGLFSDERAFDGGKTGLARALERTAGNYDMQNLLNKPSFTPSERKEARSVEEVERIYAQRSLEVLKAEHREKRLRVEKASNKPHSRACMEESGKTLRALQDSLHAHDDSACRKALAELRSILGKYGYSLCFAQDSEVSPRYFRRVDARVQPLPALVFRGKKGEISLISDCLGTISKGVNS